MTSLQAHFFAIATPILASLSQIIIKWQILTAGQLPVGLPAKILFLCQFLLRPWVLLSLTVTFLSGITWIIAMSKLEISTAYPYVAATFVIVPLAGVLLFGEHFSMGKVIGSCLVLLGIIVVLINS